MKKLLLLLFIGINLYAIEAVSPNNPPTEPISLVAQSFSTINLTQVFLASPLIYSTLAFLSISSVTIWLYSLCMFRFKRISSKDFDQSIRSYLSNQNYEEALTFCGQKKNLLASMVAAGIHSRKHGASVMIDAMKNEGKRGSTGFWQKLSLLNDIVIIAPMFGLLGTVIGMFYAFYDINRSVESVNSLFDGLGVAVGTTVVGLLVAIVAMVFYTTLKYRLIKTLSYVENEAMNISQLIEIERS